MARLFFLLSLLAALPAPARAESTAEGGALAAKVQAFYERTKDFKADFQQVYRYQAMQRTEKSNGTVEVKKPGFMRWDYAKPYPKQFVLDGKALYAYDPDDNSVMVNRKFAKDSLSAAVTFLWGKGKLTDEFDVARVDKPAYGAVVLELTPRKAEGFSKLYFAVDAATGQVIKSIIFDAEGNENQVTFLNAKTNTGIPDSRFAFQIPKGAQVKEL